MLVAISSVLQGDVAIVPPALAALARHPVRVVATIGPNDATAVGELPPNARLERFVSHLALLKRAVRISHAGHGSVMKGLWSGVPIVLVPWGRDQPGVAARAERIGIARVVGPSALDELPDAIDASSACQATPKLRCATGSGFAPATPSPGHATSSSSLLAPTHVVRGRSALPRDTGRS